MIQPTSSFMLESVNYVYGETFWGFFVLKLSPCCPQPFVWSLVHFDDFLSVAQKSNGG